MLQTVVPVNAVIPGSITLLTTVLALSLKRETFSGCYRSGKRAKGQCRSYWAYNYYFLRYLHLVQTQEYAKYKL
jgi:hypothetical protein